MRATRSGPWGTGAARAPVPEVGKHMKSSACGSRKINAKPDLYVGGVVAISQRSRDKPIT